MGKNKAKVVDMSQQQEERSEALVPTLVPMKDLQSLGNSIFILISTPGLTGQELYWGKRSINGIERAMKTAREVSKEVVEAFAKLDEEGNPVIDMEKQVIEFPDAESQEAYNKEIENRFNEALEIGVFKFDQQTLMGTRFTGQVPDMELLVKYCGA